MVDLGELERHLKMAGVWDAWQGPALIAELKASRDPRPSDLLSELGVEITRQDAKHGPYQGTRLGVSRLALATLEDEVREARDAWRVERFIGQWAETRHEVLQVAAVAIRTLRDALL